MIQALTLIDGSVVVNPTTQLVLVADANLGTVTVINTGTKVGATAITVTAIAWYARGPNKVICLDTAEI